MGKEVEKTGQKITLLKQCVAETIGTFCLVFAGTGAIIINDVSQGKVTHVGIALTFGLVVMAMIYAIGETSGAHLNPAVTIGFWISKRFPTAAVGPFVGSQVLGAFAASATLWCMFTHPTLGATHPAGSAAQTFILEMILSGMLMFVILSVASGPKEKGLMAGVAIGGVIAFEALFAGPISGASMNPARSLAPAVISGGVADVWIYLAAPVLGAVLGVIGHKEIEP